MLTDLTVLEQLQTGKQLRSRRYVCAWKCPYAHNPSLGHFCNVAFETIHIFTGLRGALSLHFQKDRRVLRLCAHTVTVVHRLVNG